MKKRVMGQFAGWMTAAVVAACFEWVFPAVAPYMPFNETTVGER